MTIKLSDYVFEFLKQRGVEHVFLLPGGGCMHLVDSLSRSGIDHTVCLHEQACAIAADGYAQYTGKLGVALVTTGPGATNAITGVAGSWIDSVPVLVISGQVKRADLIGTTGVRQRGPQEVDIISMVKGITKYAQTVLAPTDIKMELEQATATALRPRRGPVWLDIPLDVQSADIDVEESAVVAPESHYEIASQNKIGKWFREAKTPVILAGVGIQTVDAREAFRRFVEDFQIPVLTTWRAADLIPEKHPLYCGRPGTIAQRRANLILQRADLLICIGARLDELQVGFNYDGFATTARKIIVDVDPAEIMKRSARPNEIRVCTDSAHFMRKLNLKINGATAAQWEAWVERCNWYRYENPVFPKQYPKTPSDFINPYQFIEELAEASSPDDVIVPASAGAAAEMMAQTWPVKEGQRFIFSPGLGSMGWGLPQAIGVAIASGRRVISVIGDGDLQHNLQELQTIARLNLPIKLFVWNNGGYNSIRNSMTAHFNNPVCCDTRSGVGFPDIQNIAKSVCIEFIRLPISTHFRYDLLSTLTTSVPTIIEVFIDPDVPTAPRLHSRILPDGTMKTETM
jgi:acetolactate synthase-1/2/3 large subunit